MFLSHYYLLTPNISITCETDLITSSINKDSRINDRHFIVLLFFLTFIIFIVKLHSVNFFIKRILHWIGLDWTAQPPTKPEPFYRRDHRAMRSKFRYLSKFTAASRGFHCDSNAFELNNSINHGKITMLNISIYCLWIRYLTHIVCAINISDRSKCWNCT